MAMKVESEKLLDRKLKREVENRDGFYIKMVTTHISGLPDRLVILPGAHIFFAEIKTTKKDLRKLQKLIRRKIMRLGIEVYKVDSSEVINQIIKNHDDRKKSI